MENFYKSGKRGGKEVVAAAAEEQPQREERSSHARAVARRAIFEFGAGLEEAARKEGRRVRAPTGKERALVSPTRKRRRVAGAGGGGGSVASREPPRRVGKPADEGGCQWGANPILDTYRRFEGAFSGLLELVVDEEGRERIHELKRLVDSQRTEFAECRLELRRAKDALHRLESGKTSVASSASRAALPGGRPEARVTAPKVVQPGEWVRVGKGGRPAREVGQRVQLLEGVVNPPPGMGVAAKKRQGGAAKGGPPPRQGGNAVGGAPKRKGAAAAVKPQQPKRAARPKLPRNPAVLMTAVAGRSYASLLREAEDKVDLLDIGIDVGAKGGGLVVKRARNGGYLFEVPGEGGAAKADRLARELGEVLVGGAKVARPVKFAEVRVTGLVDGVTPETVAAAFVKCGECPRDDLTVGEIRRSPGGLGAMWMRCPLAAALKAVARGGLRLGWALAGVQLLEARPLQCYRCLKFGHLAAACTGPEDRKGRCFRCGGGEHVAKECSADPRCLLCEKAGANPGHRLGSRACPAAKAAWAKARGGRPGAWRPEGPPGRSRGGKPKKGKATPAPAGGAVGPGAVFRVPDRPALRAGRKEGGAEARAPLAPVRAEAPPAEAEGAGDDDCDVISCTQPSGSEGCSRMEIAEEEREVASCTSLLLLGGLDDWEDSPPTGET